MKKIFVGSTGYIRAGWSIALAIIAMFAASCVVGMIWGILTAFLPINNEIIEFFLPSILTGIAAAVVIILLFKLLYKRPAAEMGLDMRGWIVKFLHGAAIALVAMSAVVLSFSLFGNTTYTWVGFTPQTTLPVILDLILMILVGIYEEILARGYIMTASRTTGSKLFVFLSSAILFSLLHFANPGFAAIPAINIALVAIVFAYMFIRTGSIWLPIGCHFMWNFAQGSIWGMSVSGMPQYGSLVKTVTEAPALIAGGEFGPEGGLAVTAVMVLMFLYTHFVVKKQENPVWTMDKLTKE
jgi:membrane protease YdiL (CAAX protease family)